MRERIPESESFAIKKEIKRRYGKSIRSGRKGIEFLQEKNIKSGMRTLFRIWDN